MLSPRSAACECTSLQPTETLSVSQNIGSKNAPFISCEIQHWVHIRLQSIDRRIKSQSRNSMMLSNFSRYHVRCGTCVWNARHMTNCCHVSCILHVSVCTYVRTCCVNVVYMYIPLGVWHCAGHMWCKTAWKCDACTDKHRSWYINIQVHMYIPFTGMYTYLQLYITCIYKYMYIPTLHLTNNTGCRYLHESVIYIFPRIMINAYRGNKLQERKKFHESVGAYGLIWSV